MGHLRVTLGHLRVTISHLRVTMGHLRVILFGVCAIQSVCCVSWGGDNGLLKRLAAPGWLGSAVRWVQWTAIISSVPHCSHSCLQLSSPRSPQSALR